MTAVRATGDAAPDGAPARSAPLVAARGAAWLLALALAGCGSPTEDAATAPGSRPESEPESGQESVSQSAPAFEHAALERFEPGVAEILGDEIARFEAARDDAGGSAPAAAWGRLGMVYHAHHLRTEALFAYTRAAALAGDEHRWHYYRGVLLAESGDLVAAVDALRTALDLDPDDVATRLHLGNALLSAARTDEAGVVFGEVLTMQPASAAALAGLGRVAMAAGDYADAIERFTAALERQPGADKLHHPLALAYRRSGDTEAARRHLALRGDRDPAFVDPLIAELGGLSRSAQFYLQRGQAALEARNFPAAAADFERAVQYNPSDPAARATLGRVLQELGRDSEALAQLDAALEIAPTHAVANYFKGALLERLGRDPEAAPFYRAALETDPDYAEPRLLLAYGLMRRKQFTAAAEHLSRLAAQRPRNVEVRYRLGLALLAADLCPQARGPLEAALAVNADYGPVLMALARRDAICAGDPALKARALSMAERLYDARPGYDTAGTLAMALAANGRHPEAAERQLEALTFARSAGVPEAMTDADANLAAFRAGRQAGRPWPPDAPVYFPPPLR